jgi:hypothetical protein
MINWEEFLKDTLFAVSGVVQHILFIVHVSIMNYSAKDDLGGERIASSLI